MRFAFENWLAASRYSLTPSVGVWDPDFRLLDEKQDVASLIVQRAWIAQLSGARLVQGPTSPAPTLMT